MIDADTFVSDGDRRVAVPLQIRMPQAQRIPGRQDTGADPKGATARHGIAAIDRQVDDRLQQGAPVDHHRHRLLRGLDPGGDRLAQDRPQEGIQFGEQSRDVDILRLVVGLPPREIEKLTGHRGRALRRADDLLQAVAQAVLVARRP